ncbi:hypothetical protein [Kitasatospora sp. NPDC050543]|uniref:hypothetical protein n=1 Tax=Kitasatospora sp. NPDC050543 TaxID=3364054 RepID=UPI00379A9D51
MVPEGYTYVKGHIRRKPRPRINKTSGWLIAALVVGGLWLYGQGGGGSATTTNTNPGTTAPASAPAAGH